MEREGGLTKFVKEAAIVVLAAGVVTRLAGLPPAVWVTLLDAGLALGLGWVGMKLFNRSRAPQTA